MLLVSTGVVAGRENKGVCPPSPPRPKAKPAKVTPPPRAPASDAKFAGTVTLMVVISDRGYVCDAQIIRGVEKWIDEEAVKSVRQWHVQPVRKDRHNVPVVATVDVNFWLQHGELIHVPATPSPPETQTDSNRQ